MAVTPKQKGKVKPPAWAARLRRARRKAGYSQKTLGEALGVEQGQVSRWETGKNVPSKSYAARISALTGAPVSEITPVPVDADVIELVEDSLGAMRNDIRTLLERLAQPVDVWLTDELVDDIKTAVKDAVSEALHAAPGSPTATDPEDRPHLPTPDEGPAELR